MALTNEELEQILTAVQEEGWRFQLPSHNFEDVKDVVLGDGELVNLVDIGDVRVGDGTTAIKELAGMKYARIGIPVDATAEEQARRIWIAAQAKTDIYQFYHVGLPEPVLQAFIAQKPENFSLMRGEEISDLSPVKQFMANAPNAAGAFDRNYHFGDVNRDPDAATRQSLSYQADTLQGHKQGLTYRISQSYHTSQTLMLPGSTRVGPTPQQEGWQEAADNYWYRIGGVKTDPAYGEARVSKETRSANIMTIKAWRTY